MSKQISHLGFIQSSQAEFSFSSICKDMSSANCWHMLPSLTRSYSSNCYRPSSLRLSIMLQIRVESRQHLLANCLP